MTTVNLADAKARLSELVELAAAGERVIITKRTARQSQSAAELIRSLRDEARY